MVTASDLNLSGNSVAERQGDLEGTPRLTSEEEFLRVPRFRLTAGLTEDLLGWVCGRDAATANSTPALGRRVLEQSLATAGCLPKREFKDAAEFAESRKNEQPWIFDGTEQRTQRPRADEAQKEPSSGKKGAPRQSRELEEPAAKEFSRPSLLGGETARLPEVPRRIPAGARRVEELPGTSRSRLPGQRER